MSTLAGFCFSKGSFFGKSVLLLFVLSNMMVPFQAKLMPIYEVIRAVRLTDNYLGILLPSLMTNAMYIFFVKQFCDDLPSDMYEAGIVDGAGPFRIYFKIFLPLMGPIVATIIILDIIHVWNDLLWPMIVLTKQSLSTIQIGLIRYTSGSNGVVHAGVTTALSILSIIPLGIAFCFLQKYIVQSIASTGLKQ
ncbi:MAG: carbohydrate ABC transporter permease [Sphaerochaetaceae bacterium]|nr:carbohydrate ABC transporter permease [Sphaerochaetaceae bacterium]